MLTSGEFSFIFEAFNHPARLLITASGQENFSARVFNARTPIADLNVLFERLATSIGRLAGQGINRTAIW